MNKFIGSLNTMLFGVFMLMTALFNTFLLCIDSPGLLARIQYLGYNKTLALFSYVQLIIFSILYMIFGNRLIYKKSWAEKFTFNIALGSLLVNSIIFLFLLFRLKGGILTINANSFTIRINPLHLLGGVIYPIFLIYYFRKRDPKKIKGLFPPTP